MENWTEEQLREAVSKKGNLKATTDIVCKHFLEAIEDQKYGYFWCALVLLLFPLSRLSPTPTTDSLSPTARRQCPNGENCMYRHALPPGFVLKSQRKKEDDDAKNREISLEDFLEVEVRPSSLLRACSRCQERARKTRADAAARLPPLSPPLSHRLSPRPNTSPYSPTSLGFAFVHTLVVVALAPPHPPSPTRSATSSTSPS